MTSAVTAYTLKTQLGRILRRLQERERFVVLRRNRPVGIFLSIEDYVKEHPDQYEDVEDFIDTLLEESDSEFQRSLRKTAPEIKRGHYLSTVVRNYGDVLGKALMRRGQGFWC